MLRKPRSFFSLMKSRTPHPGFHAITMLGKGTIEKWVTIFVLCLFLMNECARDNEEGEFLPVRIVPPRIVIPPGIIISVIPPRTV